MIKAIIKIFNFLKFQTYLGTSYPSRPFPTQSRTLDKPLPEGKDGLVSSKDLNEYFNGSKEK